MPATPNSSRGRGPAARGPAEERAEGAETDRLCQRRNDYTELHDPWSPENIGQRRRDSLDRLQRAGPFNAPRQPNGPDGADSTPDHDIS